MDRTINMTSGSPSKLILRLALPLILTNLGQQLYGVVDATIVGQGVGVKAFAALGSCDWLCWMVLWTIQGLTQGFSALTSKHFGAGDMDAFHRAEAMCIRLCLIGGLCATVACVLLAGPLLRLLKTPEDIYSYSVLYLTMIWGGTLIVLAYNMAAALLRSVGDGKTPLIAMLTAGVSNIVLDLVFVLVLHLGIFGAALATLLAQLFAFLYCLRIILRSKSLRLKKKHFARDPKTVKELLHLGIPLALSALIVDIGGILAQSVINTFGSVFIAGCTAANKLHGLLDCSAVALGYASSTYIGQNLGAGRIDRIQSGIRKATVISLILGGSITVLMLLTGRRVVSIFLSPGSENAAQALEVAYQYVIVMSFMLTGAYLMNLYRYSLQGLGNSKDPFLSGLFELGARVFVAFVFPLFLGSSGLFFMDGFAWWAAGIFQIICFYRTLRKISHAKFF